MSRNVARLAELVRLDLERAKPILESVRLDDLIGFGDDWKRIGLPTSSMGGGTGHGAGPADPTGQDATTRDEGNDFPNKLEAHLDGLQRHLRGLIQLDLEAPRSKSTCTNCGKVVREEAVSNMRAGVCGPCRKNRR